MTRIVVGCDGADSTVAKRVGLKQPENLLVGLQTTVNGLFEKDTVEIFLEASPDFFGWLVPVTMKEARIGVASRRNTFNYFRKLLKMRVGTFKKPTVRGLIRYGLMKKTVSDNVILVGDAACQVKPFSGGGLVYGLLAAGMAGVACIKALKRERFDEEFFLKSYENVWKEKLMWPIIKGLVLRKVSEKLPTWAYRFLFNPLTRLLIESLDVDFL